MISTTSQVNTPVTLYDGSGAPISRRDLNDPATLRQVSEIFAREFRGMGSDTSSPLSNVWVYSIVSSIATKISHVPNGWWKKSSKARGVSFSKENWVPDPENPYDDLLDVPNEWQDRNRFIEQWVTFLLCGGNVWIYLGYDQDSRNGIPSFLLLFSNRQVSPIRKQVGLPPTGWMITLPNGGKEPVPLDRMIHTMLPNDVDPYMGLPPWAAAKRQMLADDARIAFDQHFFGNNATPDAVLTYKPGPINSEIRKSLLEGWHEAYGGTANAGSMAVIGGDFDLKVLGVDHSQSQYLESREFTRQELASIYGYPVQLLNAKDSGSLSKDSLTMARNLLWENAIMPNAVKFENAISRLRFLGPTALSKRKFYFDYDGLPVMVDSMKTKIETLKVMIESGIPLNTAIAKLDIGVADIDGGDVALISTRLQSIEEASTPKWEEKRLELEIEEEFAPEEDESDDDIVPAVEEKSKKPVKRLNADYNIRINSCITIDVVLAQKIKRFLFDCKNDALTSDTAEPFSITAKQERWSRTMTPYLLAAFITGYNASKDNHISIKEGNLKLFVDNLRSNENNSIINNREVSDIIRDQINFSFRVIHNLWSIMRKSGNNEKRINELFTNIIPQSRGLASKMSLWSRNSGEYIGSRGKTKVLSTRKNCQHGGSYPGDPKGTLDALLSCSCVVATLEEKEYEARTL